MAKITVDQFNATMRRLTELMCESAELTMRHTAAAAEAERVGIDNVSDDVLATIRQAPAKIEELNSTIIDLNKSIGLPPPPFLVDRRTKH